jgi:hypothetical protein
MKVATPEDVMINGKVEQGDSLESWAANLADAVKAYKGASGQRSLLLRSKMSYAAKQIINAVKDPRHSSILFRSERLSLLMPCYLLISR